MPTIDRFDGIKVNVYNGDHRPPDVHIIYNEYEALIVIETKQLYAGDLPTQQMKKALEWLSENRDWALEVFYQLNENLR
jgi:hypothetical protein